MYTHGFKQIKHVNINKSSSQLKPFLRLREAGA